jgi:PAS domain S-box-containing protein
MLDSKQKLFIIFILFAIILSAVNVSIEKLYFEDSAQKVALNNALNKTKEREGVFKNFLFQSEQTLYSIQKLDSFNEYLLNSSSRDKLENIFLSYTMSQTAFMQLRYIDKDGFEKIRVDRDKENLQSFVVPQNKLQNKANRYYFYDSKTKPLNKVWFSALDLNMERGKVEVPYRPTIRAMLPIEQDGKFNGVLIINYLMDGFIKKFTNAPLYDMILCDAKGYPLYHYEKSKSWGYYSNPKYTIENDFPTKYKDILNNNFTQTEHFVSRKLDVPVYGGLYLILQLKKSYIDEQNEQSNLQFISISLITLITSFILAFLIVKIFSNTLLNITKLKSLNESLEDSNEELEQSLDNLKQTTNLYETEKIKYASILEFGSDGIHILDIVGKVVELNEAFANMLGYSKDEILNMSVKDWDIDIPQDKLIGIVQELIKNPSIFETKHKRKDGSIIDVQINAKGIELDGKKYLYASARDITAQKELEKKVYEEENYRKKNERRLELVVKLSKKVSSLTFKELANEALDIAVEITDSKIGYLHTFNEAQSEISLVTWNKEALKHCTAAYDNHYPLQAAGIWADAVREKKVVVHNDYENMKHKNGLPEGHFRLIRHMSAPVVDGDVATMIIGVGNKESYYTEIDKQLLQATADDVEKLIIRKRIEEKIKNEQLKKDLALQSGNIGIWEWIYDTNTLIWDDAMYSMYGIEKDEEKPSPYEMWSNTIDPNDKPSVEESLFNAKETNGEYNATFEITTPKGEKRYIHALGRNELDANGNVLRMVGTNTDITEIKEKDRLIAEQTKLASMGEMIGNIAHQWRQPLSVISTGATGLKIGKEYNTLTDEFFIQTCDAINDNAQYLSKTIDDFRNFIKGDRKVVEFKLTDDIESFLHLIEGTIKSNDIEIIKNIDEDITINGYPNELVQCFINIFNNSKDAFKDKKDDRLIFISTELKEDKVNIIFKDNAGGIPEDILPKIFEPYFTTKHQSQGTGLGLHMTYNLIVEGMNGTIEANNVNYEYNGKEYFGAEFKIILPLK